MKNKIEKRGYHLKTVYCDPFSTLHFSRIDPIYIFMESDRHPVMFIFRQKPLSVPFIIENIQVNDNEFVNRNKLEKQIAIRIRINITTHGGNIRSRQLKYPRIIG